MWVPLMTVLLMTAPGDGESREQDAPHFYRYTDFV
jgi:hypothetical protein